MAVPLPSGEPPDGHDVLARSNRLTSSKEFARAVRKGRRAGSATMVVHLGSPQSSSPEAAPDAVPPRVGFVVGRAVGPAVRRNQVKRRLRHLARERVGRIPDCSVLVVRALPPAARATYAELGADFDKALRRLTGDGHQ